MNASYMVLVDGVGHGLIHDRTAATELWCVLRLEHPTAHVVLTTRNGMPWVAAKAAAEPAPRAYDGPYLRADGRMGGEAPGSLRAT